MVIFLNFLIYPVHPVMQNPLIICLSTTPPTNRGPGPSPSLPRWESCVDYLRAWQESTFPMWVFPPKIGGKPPKMDGENNGKPLLKWMIWGNIPYFRKHPWLLAVGRCWKPSELVAESGFLPYSKYTPQIQPLNSKNDRALDNIFQFTYMVSFWLSTC